MKELAKVLLGILLASIMLSGCSINTDPEGSAAAESGQANAQTEAASSSSSDETVELTPLFANQIADGEYSIEVSSSSSMFRIVSAKLKVTDDTMTAVLTLSGTGYGMLYRGTSEEALLSTEDAFIHFVEDAEGKYTYEVPVEALDRETDVAAWSTKKERWYDRILVFRSSLIPADALITENNSSDAYPESEPASSTANSKETVVESDDDTSAEEAAKTTAAQNQQDQAKAIQALGLENGSFLIDVSFSGGSGRVSIESPTTLTVENGKITATVSFSSPHYTYIIVEDTTYYPFETTGSTTRFEIPVELDTDLNIVAQTTAMSEPHDVLYTLRFDSASLGTYDPNALFIVDSLFIVRLCVSALLLIVIVTCTVILTIKRRNNKREKVAADHEA